MKYYINNCTDPYWNMAFDEWCLHNGPAEPVFYLWRNSPAVIIGHNQNPFAEVNLDYLKERGILLARRVTGGGAVYHDLQNMNYTFVGPIGSVSHMFFADAISALGVELITTDRNDIFVDGRKVSGYGKCVWHDRELIHGTLMYDVDIETLTGALNVKGSKLEMKGVASIRSRVTNLKDYLPRFHSLDEVQAELQKILEGTVIRNYPGSGMLELSPAQKAEIDELATSKFASGDWLYGRYR